MMIPCTNIDYVASMVVDTSELLPGMLVVGVNDKHFVDKSGVVRIVKSGTVRIVLSRSNNNDKRTTISWYQLNGHADGIWTGNIWSCQYVKDLVEWVVASRRSLNDT